ncbi:MAG TPA: cytochrome c-type biogenesis CcmF C-terminal domain-containing protein, partial [Vicinamibacteria bacterium]
MTAAAGRTLILLALLVSAAGAVVAFAVGRRPTAAGARWAERFAYAFAALMIAANLVMVYALLTHDFSVSYVAQVGSRALPAWVTVVSLWSSLEGSILFWGLVLGVYVAGATWATRERHPEYAPYAIGTWLACGTFFAFLIAGPAQPFLTVPNPPADGPGPNPLLQNHVLMAIHPPFLYLGYVGMTIPFGLAAAALLTGRLGPDFVRALRTWLLLPWTFLSVAIVLGGWWAYEVLGWGGYWAWDPVENASFLPWLTATAALHSALLMERKGTLKAWTVTLVMATFLLTILGTFMTRSGVFNSVHSFTQSDIGPTILVFLVGALAFSIALLALRVDRLGAPSGTIAPGSREAMFLVNNLLFVLFTFTVLVGTVFPLVVEATRNVQMSVGRPYFDRMAVPIGVALLFLMGVGPALPWGRATGVEARRALLPPLAGAAVAGVVGFALGVRGGWTLATVALAGYTAQVTLAELARPLRQRMRGHGDTLARALDAQLHQGRRRLAGYVVHGAVVVIVVAIAVSSTLGSSREVQLTRGETVELSGYTLTFLGADPVAEP